MRVIILKHFTDHAGALVVRSVVEQSLAKHGVKDAALDGLEAVADIRKRAADDDRHRIINVGCLHDLRDVGGDQAF